MKVLPSFTHTLTTSMCPLGDVTSLRHNPKKVDMYFLEELRRGEAMEAQAFCKTLFTSPLASLPNTELDNQATTKASLSSSSVSQSNAELNIHDQPILHVYVH